MTSEKKEEKGGLQGFFRNLLKPTSRKRFLFFVLADVVIFAISIYLAFLLKFDFVIPRIHRKALLFCVLIFPSVKILLFDFFKVYKVPWRYVGLSDFYHLMQASALSSVVLFIMFLLGFRPHLLGPYGSIIVIDFLISSFLTSLVKISKRIYAEILVADKRRVSGKRTLIIGAGNVGEAVARDLMRTKFIRYRPVGFLDDDINKIGSYIHDIRVLGRISDLEKVMNSVRIEAVIVAITSISFKMLKEIYRQAKAAGVEDVKVVPRFYGMAAPSINIQNLEDIKIEDLIGRQEVKVNYDEINRFINNKKVLITGAGGSIGSELVKQICMFRPDSVVLLEVDETELYLLELYLKERYPYLKGKIVPVAADVRDEERVENVFRRYRPQIVFHAAAYKHVPVMEFNPQEAVKVNIFGTYNLCKAAVGSEVNAFVYMSTDKAVNPTSVMGATKRFGEYLVMAFNELKKTTFLSVRFGNVLGSRGSVLPIFLEQLKKGGPLTITHPDMERYFMTIPEAISLVLQASVIGKRGEVMVLDMGSPVKIVKLAEELIRLHGLEPYNDIDIVATGLRPGEKLFEELLTAEEGTVKTVHERVYKAKISRKYSLEDMVKALQELEEAVRGDDKAIRRVLKKYVSTYNPQAAPGEVPAGFGS